MPSGTNSCIRAVVRWHPRYGRYSRIASWYIVASALTELVNVNLIETMYQVATVWTTWILKALAINEFFSEGVVSCPIGINYFSGIGSSVCRVRTAVHNEKNSMNQFNPTQSFNNAFCRLVEETIGLTNRIEADGQCRLNHEVVVEPVEPLVSDKTRREATYQNDEFLLNSLSQRQVQPFTVSNALNTSWNPQYDALGEDTGYVPWVSDNSAFLHNTAKKIATESSTDAQTGGLATNKHTSKKPYQCDQCEKSFGAGPSLKRHFRIHTGEKLYQCDKCEKKFVLIGGLKNHDRTHTGEKPYSCGQCEKSFAQKSSLLTHLRTHTGEKPHQCDQCKKSFTQKIDLQRHFRIHTNEKPYQCVKCEKKFARKYDLMRHNRTHNGEKPYQCVKCEKSFTRKSALTNHNAIHASETPF